MLGTPPPLVSGHNLGFFHRSSEAELCACRLGFEIVVCSICEGVKGCAISVLRCFLGLAKLVWL